MNHRSLSEKLLARYRDGDIDRRSFLGLLGMAATVVGVGGPAMTLLTRHIHAASVKEVRFDGWGGATQATIRRLILDPFEKRTGIKVNEGSYSSTEQFMAKVLVAQPGEYNYFLTSTPLGTLSYMTHGLGVALDEKKIPKLSNLIPEVVEIYRQLGKGQLPAVPASMSIQMIAYNRDKVDRAYVEKMGPNILLDPKYKGQIAGEDYWLRRMHHAALQAKQDPNNITDINAIWDKIRESKRTVLKYWKSGAEQMSLLASGEVLISDAFSQRVYILRKQGYPIEPYVPDGGVLTIGGFMPLKGSPMEAYYEMMDILLEPDVQLAISAEAGAATLLDRKKFNVPKDPDVFDTPASLTKYRPLDAYYWSKHEVEWQKDYTRVMARG